VADLDAYSSKLKAVVVDKDEIPSLIDELPILMVAACFAKGTTIFRSVSELRVKETDRILSLMKNLKKMGACIRVVKNKGVEDILVQGVGKLKGAYINSFGDHRTAMSMIIAGLCAKGKSSLEGVSSVNKSFPEFLDFVRKITK
ncbi:MAG: 3-phosphoshikimate 1-carboxyvinyltransferase, partial [Candidatus Omnitrophica bacterium]|nr:3-phosphoshikimate 1-carboxyvinyltransferase [Candidatus Omnitrophota bacterium]